MLYRNMVRCQVDIVSHHLQGRVSEDLLQGKHVPTIDQKSGGKGMSAEMGVKSYNT